MVGRLEGGLERDQLVEDTAGRPDVRLFIIAALVDLFRRHVVRSADISLGILRLLRKHSR